VLHAEDQPDLFFSPALGGYWVVRGELVLEVMRRYSYYHPQYQDSVVKGAPVVIQRLDHRHAKYRRILAAMFAAGWVGGGGRRRLTRSCSIGSAQWGHTSSSRRLRALPVVSFLQMMDLPAGRLPEFMSWIEGSFTARRWRSGPPAQHASVLSRGSTSVTGPLPVTGGHMWRRCSARRSMGGG
jgi:hypothetical protein